jgi:hypothetical protein
MYLRTAAVLAALALAGPVLAGEGSSVEAAPDLGAPALRLAALPPVSPLLGEAQAASDGAGARNILMSALYGGLAGAIIGAGIGLLEGGNYGRDIAVGAGAGIVVGAALGAAGAWGDSRALAARDGLGTTDRNPVLTAHALGLVAGRF